MRELSISEKAQLYEACLPGGALHGAHARRTSAMAAGRAAHAAAAAVEAALMEGTAVEANLEETSAELSEGPSASLGPCSEGTGHAS